jgi:uncharacterized protein (TIGR02246 family)
MNLFIKSLICSAAILSVGIPCLAEDNEPSWLTSVKAGAHRFEQSFASKDAKAIAADWLPEGTFVDENGNVYVGRDEIQKLYSSFFKANPGSQKIAVDIDTVTNTEPNVLVERGRTALIDEKGQRVSEAPYIAIHRKLGSLWPIQQVIEYPAAKVAASTPDLNWLVGKWASTTGDKTITLTNKLSSTGKFIVSEFTAADGEQAGDVMISGINPVDGRLACWIFDTTGGVGRGQWTYDKGNWYLRSMRVEPSGKRVLLTHVIRPSGVDAFDWQTTNRVVDGKLLADTEPTHVTRIGGAK